MKIVTRMVFIVLTVLFISMFVLCAFTYKMNSDITYDLFAKRYQIVRAVDSCVLKVGSLAIITPALEYSASSVIAYVTVEKTLALTSGQNLNRITYKSIIGVATGQVPFLGGVIAPFVDNEFLLCALFVVSCVLIVCLIFSRKQKNAILCQRNRRIGIQTLWTVATNSYAIGFIRGTIYKGNLKHICVPGLNCYSCPGALGACPIGALQSIFTKRKFTFNSLGNMVSTPINPFPFYVVGFIMMFGALCGRFICGFLCPFGWIQELLYKVPPKKFKLTKPFAADKYLRYTKYAVLLITVIILPLFAKQAYPWFCKVLCPSGMLFGGLSLMATNEGIRNAAGDFTVLKLSILALVIIASIIIYRPFCKYLCPLGAMYGLLNPISLYRYEVKHDKCVNCGKCKAVCPMGVDILKNANSTECIRCGECKATCPTGAIYAGIGLKKSHNTTER